MPKGSFYNHFVSKEAFAAAVVARYAENNAKAWHVMMSTAPASPLDRIRHVFDQMIAYHQHEGLLCGCLIGIFAAEIASSSETCRTQLLQAQAAWRDRLAELITQAQAANAVRANISALLLAETTWNVWEGALLRMKIEGSIRPVKDSIAVILDLLSPSTSKVA